MLNISFVLLLDDSVNAKVYLANFFDTLVSYQNLNYDIVILNNCENTNDGIGKHYRGYKYNVINVKDKFDRANVLNIIQKGICRFKTVCVANLNFKHKPYFVSFDETDKQQVKKAVKLIAKTTKIRNDVDKQTYKKIAVNSKSALFARLIKFSFRHPLTAFRAIFARKVALFFRLSKDNPQLASEKIDVFLSRTISSKTEAPINNKRSLFVRAIKFSFKHPKTVVHAIFARKISTFFHLSKDNPQLASEKLDVFLSHTDNDAEGSNITIEEDKSLIIFKEKDYRNIVMPTSSSPLVSIIIPVYNQFFYTYNCLLAIKAHTESSIPYEIIVVDDCSSDETKNIENIISGIKVIHNKKNQGFLLNNNNAAKIAKGKYIYLLNNDTNPQPKYLSELVNFMETHKEAGLVGSKLIYKNGLLQEAGGIIFQNGQGANYGRLQKRTNPEFNYVKETDYISGASVLIKKKTWDAIGGFDNRYIPAYNEDSDFCFAVRKFGEKVFYIPTSIVVHFEGISNGRDTKKGIKKYQITNQKKFYKKWQNELTTHSPYLTDMFHARDRSYNKKCILVIDHYVPTFDQDAGSRTVFAYLKLFVSLGYNVKFIGDNYYRSEPYTTVLQKLGIEVLYGNYMQLHWRNYIKTNANNFDYIFLNRPHISIKYINYVKEHTKARIYYYGHDLHSLRLKREYSLYKKESTKKELQRFEKMENDIFKSADVIYYPSQIEVDYVKRINPNYDVRVLQPYMFENTSIKKINPKAKDLLFVGGFAHYPNVDACVWFVKNVFPIIKKAIPNIKLNIVGSHPTKEVKDLESSSVKVHGFVSDEKLTKLYANNAVFVSPLRYGAGIKGKIVEAMNNGIPIVTTTCGAEGIIAAKKSMIIENNNKKIANAVIGLYKNLTLRKQLVGNAKQTINQYYSIAAAKKNIEKDFN